MKAKRLILLFLVIGLASTVIIRLQKRATAVACDFCRRAVCHGTFYRIAVPWGLPKKACCARCGIRYEKENPGRVKEAKTIDFATGDWVPARAAVYVEGSDFSHCNPEAVLREPQGESLMKCHDRCLPSVVAFRRKEDAQTFIVDHGGHIITHQQLLEKV